MTVTSTSTLASSSNPTLALLDTKLGSSSPRRRSASLSDVSILTRTQHNGTEDEPEPPKLQDVPKPSSFGALLSRTLPKYTGPFQVGVRDLEVPISRQTFGTFRHKHLPHSDAGITVDTVLFTLFYPCRTQERPKHVVWFPRLSQTIDGFLKMAKRTPNVWYRMVAYPAAAAIIHGTTFPASKGAPLATPPSSPQQFSFHRDGKWPFMIFSHGVGCSRLMYSAFCGEMASRGFIVAALEHRDGTSPSSTIATADGRTTTLDWLQWSDLHWPELSEQPKDDSILRREQVKCRVAEIEAVIDTVQRISKGEAPSCLLELKDDIDWSTWQCVDARSPVLTGHSLGGGAALAVSAKNSYDYRAVIAFDPAVRRLIPWNSSLPHPILVVNSEEVMVQPEFKDLFAQFAHTATAGLQVYMIGGSTHPSFSDVFLILPHAINKITGLGCPARAVIDKIVHATEEFLTGKGGAGGQVSYDEVYRDEEDMKWKMAIKGRKRFFRRSSAEKQEGGNMYKATGKPGELALYRF
ncbi:uncharacterized protein PHACADRAFT_127563 [Phanerochaete carnosa HHB-10118-sp]|uniref:1-alkyl-2-acetylglycerophosphocholine esterase n=1 Tax=Phanerochaete carnosa (strain HHB-10118-sp) TaxID=650164 RepID=K5VK31_PHACS|nr:uncharacterized protein PHACADRAFT_127563 [Phanerochaete carnosa HHB-10118-sp]EKM51728.1 hypothetical protein PHACADRAFT_127563 [Phanerochaete carnosa HHB-10118-sp]